MSMTHEEAARILDPETSAKVLREYGDGNAQIEACDEACRVAVKALRDNHFGDPTKMVTLTLEQLRVMGGKPVWVKVIGKTGIHCDGWCEVEIREKDPFAYVWWPGSEVEDIEKIEDYGKTWACYAYHPAHIDREAWKSCKLCEKYKVFQFNAWEKPEMSLGNIDCMGTSLFCPHCGRPLTKDAWAELEKRMGGISNG